ncbi:MAG: VTT domain-containing protein [Verrucomicrobiota bacterium]
MSRALLIILVLILAGILVPFAIWGERFDAALSLEGTRAWISQYGEWAGLAGVLLLVADILLPVPSTVVMSALGLTYGWFIGGLLASAGSFLAGLIAYGACRWLGRPAALWLAGEDGLRQGEALFARRGGWLVALSRWMPVLPEAISCLAGLVRMNLRVYLVSLACGSLPVGFAFAAIGALGSSHPGTAMALSALVPVMLWITARRWMRR